MIPAAPSVRGSAVSSAAGKMLQWLNQTFLNKQLCGNNHLCSSNQIVIYRSIKSSLFIVLLVCKWPEIKSSQLILPPTVPTDIHSQISEPDVEDLRIPESCDSCMVQRLSCCAWVLILKAFYIYLIAEFCVILIILTFTPFLWADI